MGGARARRVSDGCGDRGALPRAAGRGAGCRGAPAPRRARAARLRRGVDKLEDTGRDEAAFAAARGARRCRGAPLRAGDHRRVGDLDAPQSPRRWARPWASAPLPTASPTASRDVSRRPRPLRRPSRAGGRQRHPPSMPSWTSLRCADTSRTRRSCGLSARAELWNEARGGAADELPAGGARGRAVRRLLDDGAIELVTAFRPRASDAMVIVWWWSTVGGRWSSTRSSRRPASVSIWRSWASRAWSSTIASRRRACWRHSSTPTCTGGSVLLHGVDELSHPDAGLYVVGMKSYGRAPTFLLGTATSRTGRWWRRWPVTGRPRGRSSSRFPRPGSLQRARSIEHGGGRPARRCCVLRSAAECELVSDAA